MKSKHMWQCHLCAGVCIAVSLIFSRKALFHISNASFCWPLWDHPGSSAGHTVGRGNLTQDKESWARWMKSAWTDQVSTFDKGSANYDLLSIFLTALPPRLFKDSPGQPQPQHVAVEDDLKSWSSCLHLPSAGMTPHLAPHFFYCDYT